MINDEKKDVDNKIINIYLSISVKGWTDRSEIENVGIVYASVIDILEKIGYRINLYVGDVSECGDEIMYYLVRVKTDREPLNLKKLAFTIAHPSMLRRIGFKVAETANTEHDFTNNGYGRPFTEDDKIEKFLSKKLKSNFLVFSYQQELSTNIENALKKLKNKGIKMEGYNEN